MVAKKYQNPSGGLNQAGRDYFKRKEGSNLKSPVKKGNNPRRVSFAARFAANKGPMKDDKGRPTRLALALKAWGLVVKRLLEILQIETKELHNAIKTKRCNR